jgi:serine/threonine protein kinase
LVAAIQNGTRLKHYRIIDMLGQGGMGTVYRAFDERLEREVAIKVISDDRLNSEIAHKRFRREATSLSQLIHSNVAAVFDYDEEAGHEFLVMELIQGEPLDKIIARGPMRVEDVLGIARQLLSALTAAHAVSIIHRDLKPANLMLTGSGHLKILDFGLAKAFAAAATDETCSLVTRDTVCGTVAYMSPEQLRGDPLDGRSDLFAASAVLYELLTGKRPFTGRTEAEVIDAILNRAPQAIRSVHPEVPGKLETCDRAWVG